MGLGKTLTTIALIAENAAVPLSSVHAVLKRGTNYDAFYASLNDDGSSPVCEVVSEVPTVIRTPDFPELRPTLIIAPMSVMSNWRDQIMTHLGSNCAAVTLYHGHNRKKDEVSLAMGIFSDFFKDFLFLCYSGNLVSSGTTHSFTSKTAGSEYLRQI